MSEQIRTLKNSNSSKLVTTFTGIVASIVLFISLANEVSEGETLVIDQRILESINQLSSPWLDQLLVTLTTLGGELVVAIVSIGVALVLFHQRRRYQSLRFLLIVIGSVISGYFLKLLFSRSRPELWQTLVEPSTFSFPSGHSIASAALAIGIILVLWRTRWRHTAVVVGFIYATIIGFSRLYLGVHYPTDVLASWLVVAGWSLIVIAVTHKRISYNEADASTQ
jgi:undecaprenyl-diphosphatase